MEAGIASGYPPLALLFREPKRKASRWDMILITAYHLEKMLSIEGFPIWIEESKDVSFEAKKRVIRSVAAVDARRSRDSDAASKSKKPVPHGTTYYAVPRLAPGAKWPTYESWMAQRQGRVEEEDIDSAEFEKREEKVKAMKAGADARAAQQVAGDPDLQAIIDRFSKADSP